MAMEIKHFSHKHPLKLIEKRRYNSAEEEEQTRCFRCGEGLESAPSYRCIYKSCKYNLHKKCIELEELPLKINHPLHPCHPLKFTAKPPYDDYEYVCYFCGGDFFGFAYHCYICSFDLDVKCALSTICENFAKLEHPLHEHPLILMSEKYCNKKEDAYCMGCRKDLGDGPIYRCVDCKYDFFDLHKECADLPSEINHPYHPKHPLTLLSSPPGCPSSASWSFSDKGWNWKGFVYHCSVCKFSLTLENVLPCNNDLSQARKHQHQWTVLARLMPFTCDFCGIHADLATPYLCTTCHFLVHEHCISQPRTIRITRHRHPISHVYSVREKQIESKKSRICYDDVNTDYGCYSCSSSDCNYIAHANCATHEEIWDGTTLTSEDEDEPYDSSNLITAVIKKIRKGEEVIATEIKHEYHKHKLILTFRDKNEDDKYCEGCMRLITIPFYRCRKRNCSFFLHKTCAELPRQTHHPSHMHTLNLGNHEYSYCNACNRCHHGFSYKCDKNCGFKIDIQCFFLPDTSSHPCHEHLLVLDYSQGNCSGCGNNSRQAYRCIKRCGFTLDFRCMTLPHLARYKYEKHPLSITYGGDFSLSQLYCDICEEERPPNRLFYYCKQCDTAAHPRCVIGEIPFIKVGSRFVYKKHPHPFTFVKNIWDCPPCAICKKLCFGQALQCVEPECNIIVHWNCRWDLKNSTTFYY